MNSTTCLTNSGRPSEHTVLNISAYKFVPLAGLDALRTELKARCVALELRGTILLSPEGINLFLAGTQENIHSLLDTLRSKPAFADLETKDSYSAEQPFRRMLVRLKKEIIAFGVEGIEPSKRTSEKLSARTLKAWLDEGRSVRLLDTRNDYEFDLGTFRGAEKLDLDNFRDFPEAVRKLPAEAKKQPLVMFCTGGIRCEKAGPMMERAGFEEVYQLDGGILKYFEECGGAHYDGSCFVFDNRVALDSDLQATGDILCFACQAVLTPAEVGGDKYLLGKYCPRCYCDPQESRQRSREQRQADILAVAELQSGCQAYTNVRQIYVPRRFASLSLIDFLSSRHAGVARASWLEWIQAGQIVFVSSDRKTRLIAKAEDVVRDGDHFEQQMPGTTEPAIATTIELLHEDEDLIVVNKPAPLPSHPSGRFNKNSLTWILGKAYGNDKLRLAHRLDANTSGLTILCRRQQAAKMVQHQFSEQSVSKRYVARVHGHPAKDKFRCDAPISSGPGDGGARGVDSDGLPATTEFVVLERFSDGSSLLDVRPLSGRTNQIRVHLWHLGHAIVGDPLYRAGGDIGESHTLGPDDSPMCLHAAEIQLKHPTGNQPICFSCSLPSWAED